MKLFFLFQVMFVFQSIVAQTNRYVIAQPAKTTTPVTNYYNLEQSNQTDSPDLFEIYKYASSLHERNAKIVDSMIDNLYNLKSQVNDQAFKNKIDVFLNQLKSLRLGSLVNAENDIKKIDWAIRDEIDKYKTGTSPVLPEYQPGDYYSTMQGAVIRIQPSTAANQLGDNEKYPIIKIVSKYNDKYYEIEANNVKAFISPAFIGTKISKENYEKTYSSPNQGSNEAAMIYKTAQDAFNRGSFEESRKGIDVLLSKINDPDLFYFKALTYYYQMNFENALSEISNAIKLNPMNLTYFYFRGDVYMRKNDYANAVASFSKVIDLNQSVTDAYFFRALAKSELEDRRGAIKDYDMILKYHSDTIKHNYDLPTVYNNKAYCYVELGDYQTALSLVNEALSLNSGSNWYIWDTRGELFYKTGKYKESIDDMTKAIELSGMEDNSNSYYYRGLSRLMLKMNNGCEDLSKAGELGKREAYEAIKKYCQ